MLAGQEDIEIAAIAVATISSTVGVFLFGFAGALCGSPLCAKQVLAPKLNHLILNDGAANFQRFLFPLESEKLPGHPTERNTVTRIIVHAVAGQRAISNDFPRLLCIHLLVRHPVDHSVNFPHLL
jgi:hypothetical protein